MGFEARIEEVWGGALDRYYMTYIACLEAGKITETALALPQRPPSSSSCRTRCAKNACSTGRETSSWY